MPAQSNAKRQSEDEQKTAPYAVSLPKGGGAIRGIGEKFSANPVTGTGSMTVPLSTSPGRSGFGPQLSLSYDSGSGNGPFGFGWRLSLPSITRKTDRGLPQYRDYAESDEFILSGAEDLVPMLNPDGTRFVDEATAPGFLIHRYRPRVESLFARIERWTRIVDGDTHWRSISKENILTLYGSNAESRIVDPQNDRRIFTWLICESRDDRGNAAVYSYKAEDGALVDLSQLHERNRGGRDDQRRTANRYLKRVRYGNRVPLLDEQGRRPRTLTPEQVANTHWMFEVVFDYGEHDVNAPRPDDAATWKYRADAFSSYRAGFEVRTTRVCERVLMFHHFPEETDVGNNCLVRSNDFTYSYQQNPADARNPVYTFLCEVTQSGYKRSAGGYTKRSLPPVELEYTQPVVQSAIEVVDAESLENLPIGVDGSSYAWTDLHGEGIPGVLTEQGGDWFYKRNFSPIAAGRVELAPSERVALKPNERLAGNRAQFMDLAGDGLPDLVMLSGPVRGLYEHDDGEGWQMFRPFSWSLTDDTADPNLKFVDLNGDGSADVLITTDDAFVWHASLAEEGFGPAFRVPQAGDEENGPRLIFSDSTQSIHLADLSGDGLTDLVRIRNDEVCYWPNLGYGQFGAKITMSHPPHFDQPDQFDQKRIRLADIDGSGTSDIIYLHRDGIRLHFNQSGNGWSAPQPLAVSPRVDDLVSIQIADLLGNGTACLVWSSPLPGDSPRQMRYVDLMGGQKPHLLVKTANNLGAETRVQYSPSTKFYLQDKRDLQPWITRLPFPVHVVERVETHDRISGNRFVTRYAYHHGYFDGVEREFRGFGMVEQFDTEDLGVEDGGAPATNFDTASDVPPVHTKTWFHTGVYVGRDHVSDFFAGLIDANDRGEYYREPGLTDDQARALLLPDTELPGGLTVDEEREACRALKGVMLRQEIYGRDGTVKAGHPYSVTERNFAIRALQQRSRNRHAVFMTHLRDVITYQYERNPADPRIRHELTLEADLFGNVLKDAIVGYGRRQPDPSLPLQVDRDKQIVTLVTYTEKKVSNAIGLADDHRAPLQCETSAWQLTGYAPTGPAGRFQHSDFVAPDPMDALRLVNVFDSEIPFEAEPGIGRQRRLTEQARSLYRPDDLGTAQNDPLRLLPLGTVEPRALTGESYKLAFTPGLLSQVFVRDDQPLLPLPGDVLAGAAAGRGGHVRSQELKADGRFPNSDPDDHWWIPSGRTFLSSDTNDDAAQELAQACHHFFLGRRFRDPFHTSAVPAENFVAYDPYDLLKLENRDPLGNRVTAGERLPNGDIDSGRPGNDYRVLQTRAVMDPNRNRMQVAFDILGMVAGTSVMGKPEQALGDSLAGFDPDLPEAVLLDRLDDPLTADAATILGRATTRILCDAMAYFRTKADPAPKPPVVYTIARETHDDGLNAAPRIQHSFAYMDGFGREAQKKSQAEADKIDGAPGPPRWVGSGWTIFNNKGKPVRQYEPFFSATHRFESGVEVGVSTVLFYDPVERVVVTLHPNHTYEKVVFDGWQQITWDVNDTVLLDPRTDSDVSGFTERHFADLPAVELPWLTWHTQRVGGAMGADEQTAATRAAGHAGTPATGYFDSLGRPFLTLTHNGFRMDGTPILFAVRVELDIGGNQRNVRDAVEQAGDARGRIVMRYAYDVLGNRIHQQSMDAGVRWILNDAAGKPIRAWDSRGHTVRTDYDPLRRPIRSFVTGAHPADPNQTLLTERGVYGEQHPQGEQLNLRGKLYLQLDQAGAVANELCDFKTNTLRTSRRIAAEYRQSFGWDDADAALPNAAAAFNADALEAAISLLVDTETYTNDTAYDALNRPVTLTTPHTAAMAPSIVRPRYNEANLLEQIDVNLRGAAVNGVLVWTPFIEDIDYDAKGQRARIDYGNDVTTTYDYDPLTFRLLHMLTSRDAAVFPQDCPAPPPAGWPGCQVQNLRYTYDPLGNITHVNDAAQQTIYFRNRHVDASNDYIYDPAYRLIKAAGREHLGQLGGTPIPHSYNDAPRVGIDWAANDGNAVGAYTELYSYDAAGNLQQMRHRGIDPTHPGWTRGYAYGETSVIENGADGMPLKTSNRLTSTTVDVNQPPLENYVHDAHGNIVRMPHLGGAHPTPNVRWDYRDRLCELDLGGGGTAYFTYDASGQRVRKVWEKPGHLKEERIYLGGFELYLRRQGAERLQRETLHIMDDQRRIALIETRTEDTARDDPGPPQRIRYQVGNHLASCTLELDDQAGILSYEEYTPFGSTVYQAVRSQTDSRKRYRYSGKERDAESGLYYHEARHYAPWIGRWTSTDPALFRLFDPDENSRANKKPSLNPYAGMANNPITFIDPSGQQDTGYTMYLDRMLSTPEGASRITGIPYTPPPPPTAREAEATREGRRLGAVYGQFEADLEEFNRIITRRWGGVSMWDRLPQAERQRLTNNVIARYNELPQLTEHFSDPAVSGQALRAFNEARRETYSAASWRNRIVNFLLEMAPFAAAGLVSALGSVVRRAGVPIIVDLFGGARSQIPGAINVDIAATSGIRADATRSIPLASGIADEVVVTNPYIPGAPQGARAANTWLSEATRILRPGGRITVTGSVSNKFARVPTAEELESQGLRLVSPPGPVSDPRIIAQRMFRTDGTPLDVNTLQSYVIERIR